ncbi:hypothetical protein A9995_01995 [Erythrobacter sp. QSSC1-22B]|nr:hypothetical protein A9995_01995 [Erythrobacter sp. QSSC1-22B]
MGRVFLLCSMLSSARAARFPGEMGTRGAARNSAPDAATGQPKRGSAAWQLKYAPQLGPQLWPQFWPQPES